MVRKDDMAIARKVMRENHDSLRELASGAKVSRNHPHPITASAPETRADKARPRDIPPKIWKAALAVFETAAEAKRWLYYQHSFVVYIKPIDAIQSSKGRKYILDWLESQYNVNHGVFSCSYQVIERVSGNSQDEHETPNVYSENISESRTSANIGGLPQRSFCNQVAPKTRAVLPATPALHLPPVNRITVWKWGQVNCKGTLKAKEQSASCTRLPGGGSSPGQDEFR
jgi:hypothetical protein